MLLKRFSLMLILLISVAAAVPADPEFGQIINTDGKTITLSLRGDENISWYETVDAYTVLQNKNKDYVYAIKDSKGQLIPSSVLVHNSTDRKRSERQFAGQLESKLFFSDEQLKARRLSLKSQQFKTQKSDPFYHTTFPTIGTKRLLVVIVNFKDTKMTHTHDNVDSLMNADHYSYNEANGSVNQYYRDISFGQFSPVFDVVGPVTLDSGFAYYGANDDQSNRYQAFIKETAEKADRFVNYEDYDNDGDGEVDGIHIIFAGFAENYYGADPDLLWPHRWSYSGDLQLDGRYITDYSCSNELTGTSGTRFTGIGVVCHEFGHVLGLMDYYDTDYAGSGGDSRGIGYWDPMSYGSSFNYGNYPAMHNAWSRIFLNWLTPVELSLGDFVTVNPAETHNEAYYFVSPTSDELFVMENRQQTSWDKYLHGPGLLIFHVDQDYGTTWQNNTINCDPDHQAFDIEEADGFGNVLYGDAGDPFPGTSFVAEFSDDTTPNSHDWAGNRSELPLVNIMESDSVITFSVGYVGLPDAPDTLVSGNFTENSIDLNWELNSAKDTVLLLAQKGVAPGRLKSYEAYELGDELDDGGKIIYIGIDTAFTYTGLEAGTEYYFELVSKNDTILLYSAVLEISASTSSPVFYQEDFANGLPLGWEINDVSGMGSWSTENLESREFGASTDTNGFLIMDSEHFGDVDQLQNAELITRPFNFGLSRHAVLKFQHKFVVKSVSIGTLYYTMNDGSTWFKLQDWTQSTDGVENVELDITDHVSYLNNVRFKFSYRGKNEKFWCIDDIKIESSLDEGLEVAFFGVPVEGSKPLHVTLVNNSVSYPSSIDSCIWAFGAEFSFTQDAQYTFRHSGNYDVSLNVWNEADLSGVLNRLGYITVINDAPLSLMDGDTVDVIKDQTDTLNMKQIFYDKNNDISTYSWSGNSTQLALELFQDTLLVVTPASDYTGQETLVLGAQDSEGLTAQSTVMIWVSETGTKKLPTEFSLSQNYPNPFNPVTRIDYNIPSSMDVTLNVYDVKGNLVKTLTNSFHQAGAYTAIWNGSSQSGAAVGSGMYIFHIQAGDNSFTRKTLLMK